MKKKQVVVETAVVKVAEYVEHYNASVIDEEDKITRHDVYKMIKEGKLEAVKNEKNAWLITVKIEKEIEVDVPECPSKKCKSYTVKEFVELYNKRHSKNPITISEVRKLLSEGKLKGEKVNRKWTVTASPSRRIKL